MRHSYKIFRDQSEEMNKINSCLFSHMLSHMLYLKITHRTAKDALAWFVIQNTKQVKYNWKF